jgi:hypothetical protein
MFGRPHFLSAGCLDSIKLASLSLATEQERCGELGYVGPGVREQSLRGCCTCFSQERQYEIECGFRFVFSSYSTVFFELEFNRSGQP